MHGISNSCIFSWVSDGSPSIYFWHWLLTCSHCFDAISLAVLRVPTAIYLFKMIYKPINFFLKESLKRCTVYNPMAVATHVDDHSLCIWSVWYQRHSQTKSWGWPQPIVDQRGERLCGQRRRSRKTGLKSSSSSLGSKRVAWGTTRWAVRFCCVLVVQYLG